MALELRKASTFLTVGGLRTVVMENQGLTVYDIYLVRYVYIGTNLGNVNQTFAMALSIRFGDQVEDAGVVGTGEMVDEPGIFAVSNFQADLSTEGALAINNVDTIPFAKPFRVPYAAFLANAAVSVGISAGVEIYFERVTVSAREKAFISMQAGGRIQTS